MGFNIDLILIKITWNLNINKIKNPIRNGKT